MRLAERQVSATPGTGGVVLWYGCSPLRRSSKPAPHEGGRLLFPDSSFMLCLPSNRDHRHGSQNSQKRHQLTL